MAIKFKNIREFIFITRDEFNEISEHNHLINHLKDLDSFQVSTLRERARELNLLITAEEKETTPYPFKTLIYNNHIKTFLKNSYFVQRFKMTENEIVITYLIVVNVRKNKRMHGCNYIKRYLRTFVDQVESIYSFIKRNRDVNTVLDNYIDVSIGFIDDEYLYVNNLLKEYFRQLKQNKKSLKKSEARLTLLKGII